MGNFEPFNYEVRDWLLIDESLSPPLFSLETISIVIVRLMWKTKQDKSCTIKMFSHSVGFFGKNPSPFIYWEKLKILFYKNVRTAFVRSYPTKNLIPNVRSPMIFNILQK